MTPDLYARLVDHLANGSEPRRNHARYRLSLDDAREYELPPGWTPPPQPPVLIPLAENLAALRIINRCGYRSTEGCGCSGARCGLSGRTVTHHQCLDCAKKYGDA